MDGASSRARYGSPDAETFRTVLLRKLTRRSRRGAKLASSDAGEGTRMADAEALDDNLAALLGSTSCAMRWRMRAGVSPASSRERNCPALAATSASHTSCPRSRTPPIHAISSE